MRSRSRREPSSTRAVGAGAEARARRYYRLRGYRVLAQNARAAGNELDLVVRRGRRLVFAEVKAKTGEGYGEPAEMVDDEKQRRLRLAAEAWLAARPDLSGLDVAFDVVAVERGRIERIAEAF